MNTTVPTPEAKGYAVTAAELRRIADALDTLPPGDKTPYLQVSILPNEKTIEAVDAVALAVLGKRGKTQPADAGKWRHIADGGFSGYGYISIHALVPGPPDERDAEIERLKAELAKAQAYLGTEGAVAQPKPDTYVAEFTGRASVPDMQTRPTLCSAEVEPGLVCGKPIYWDKGANAWWHQNREDRFKHTATGPSVPPEGGE